MSGYYGEKLSAERLLRCYEIAPDRVKQYLAAEIDHVVHNIRPGDSVLELGCGYGRILPALAAKAESVWAIDSSLSSLLLAQEMLADRSNIVLACMNGVQLALTDDLFDVVVCIQNGVSAFHVDQSVLIKECIRVARPGGLVLLSSYSEKFWEARLDWFVRQSEAGLLGEVDFDQTGDGRIVCKDGFTATTIGREEFQALTANLDAAVEIVEVDNSSLFCEIRLP